MIIINPIIHLSADRFPLVRDIGWNQVENTYTHPDRTLEFDVFIYVTEGRIVVIEEDREYVVNKGEYLFLKNGLHHWGITDLSDVTSWYWVHFNSIVQDLTSYKEFPPLRELDYYFPDHYQYKIPLPKHGSIPLHLTMEHRLKLLLDNYHKRTDHIMTKISMQAYELFLELQQATDIAASRSEGKADTIAGRVMAYLVKHAEEDFNSRKLSTCLELNYSYVSAAFRKQTGQSIIQVHTKLRMNKAIDLMRNSSMNISQISERLGYDNPYYFSRVFKKTLGEPPSSYINHFY